MELKNIRNGALSSPVWEDGTAPGSALQRLPFVALLPLLVLILGLAITVAAWRYVSQKAAADLAAEFNYLTEKIQDHLALRLDAHVQVLRGVDGLFDAAKEVSREQFRVYVEKLQLAKRMPGIQGVGFAKLIPASELERHTRSIRGEGFPDYHIRPEGARDPYTSIIYLEPFSDRNLRAFGYDMLSEPVRREAMTRARETGRSAITGKVVLVQETDRDVQTGFLVYVPVYRTGTASDTVEARRANLIGWAYSPMRMGDFMRNFLGGIEFVSEQSALDVEIYDGDSMTADSLMFDADGKPQFAGTGRKFRRVLPIDFAGHRWALLVTGLPDFEARLDDREPITIAVAGATVSILLALLLWAIVASRHRFATALAETERLNRQLAASEESYRALFETVPIGVTYHHGDGRLVMANPAAERILGASVEELKKYPMSDPTWDCIREDGSSMSLEDMPGYQALVRKEIILDSVCGVISPFTGRRIWLRVIAMPVETQANGILAYSVIEDITERRRAQAELEQYRRSLEILVSERTSQLESANRALDAQRAEAEDLFNHAPVGYHSLDSEGKFLRVNDTELAWLGYAREEMIGRPITDFFTEAGRMAFAARFPRFKESGSMYGMEFDMVRRDGSLLPVVIDATLIRDEGGDYVASRSTMFDNTERKERQRQIDVLNANLAKRADEAEAASRAKSAFLANMSHEFRTPMNGIMGMTYMLQRVVSDPAQLEKLATIGKTSKHLLDIINDVLEISRMEGGEVELACADFSLGELVESALGEIRGTAEAKGLVLLSEMEPGLVDSLRGDAARMGQVLGNFLDNAVKFTNTGGIVLRVGRLDEGDKDILLRFEIQDSGIGIAAEDQSRLFQAFEQVDASYTRAYGGTGLGLAINKHIVQLMGGQVGVDSQIGSGSKFWFVIRLKKSPKP